MREARLLAGWIDYWDGRRVGGWIVDRSRPDVSCDVDVYANGHFLLRAPADQPRPDLVEVSPRNQKKGFLLEIPAAQPVHSVEVCLARTTTRIPAIETLGGLIGRPPIDLLQFSGGTPSRWTPIPSKALICHVTGQQGSESDLQRMYRATGFTQAADIYNVARELGADPHQPGYSIVDLGCGCGRVATFLAQWLEDAEYLGVDVWNVGTEWATSHITPTYETYRFYCFVSVAKGYERSEHYTVPIGRGAVDYVVSTSLFTHLDADASSGYLEDVGRMLKCGGLAYITFFFRDDESIRAIEAMARQAGLPLVREPKAWFYGSNGYLDVFYDMGFIVSIARGAGLRPLLYRRGSWRGPAHSNINPMAFQDLVVFTKE